ncbi:hypothetical protein [Porticoccus sp.]
MIDTTPREFKADVVHQVEATADTIADIEAAAEGLKGQLVACREDGHLYLVCAKGAVTKTNLRSREQL